MSCRQRRRSNEMDSVYRATSSPGPPAKRPLRARGEFFFMNVHTARQSSCEHPPAKVNRGRTSHIAPGLRHVAGEATPSRWAGGQGTGDSTTRQIHPLLPPRRPRLPPARSIHRDRRCQVTAEPWRSQPADFPFEPRSTFHAPLQSNPTTASVGFRTVPPLPRTHRLRASDAPSPHLPRRLTQPARNAAPENCRTLPPNPPSASPPPASSPNRSAPGIPATTPPQTPASQSPAPP